MNIKPLLDRVVATNGIQTPNLQLTMRIFCLLKLITLHFFFWLNIDCHYQYSSREFNELLPAYNIIHPMSRAETPMDNAATESING